MRRCPWTFAGVGETGETTSGGGTFAGLCEAAGEAKHTPTASHVKILSKIP